MSCGSQINHMMFIIATTIFMFISFQSTHILVANASLNAAETDYFFNGHHGLPEKNIIEKVSGEDESEDKEAQIIEKFRALLGLKSFKSKTQTPTDNEQGYGLSPSPSPSSPTIEAPTPAPAPAPPSAPMHHTHHPFHHFSPIRQRKKTRNEDRDGNNSRIEKILVSVFVSVGATFALCVIGLICVCRRFRRQRKRSTRRRIPVSKCESKYANSQTSVKKKVSSDLDLVDLFCLDSLGTVKQFSETENKLSNQNTRSCEELHQEESKKEPIIRSESDNVSCCEIVSVHETVESVKYESDEFHSSDDESFQSANVRLSNASAGSPSEKFHILSPKGSITSPCSVTSPMDLKTCPPHDQCTATTATASTPSLKTPPPPPPPPPPLPSSRLRISRSNSSCSTRIMSRVLSSHTLPFSSSPRSSDSSSGSNQTPQCELPPSPRNPPKPLVGIPPPPCPPPFFKGISDNPLRGPPPPPPYQLTPLGKDGVPLPKLKPLHWDKVRAAPNRSMVWDKLRSSSFEFDEEMIESLFGYDLQSSTKNDEAKSKSPSPSKHVLEPKRLQNITILSKAVNVTAEQICDALIQGEGLSLQQLEALVKMEPTKEEAAKLTNYKGNINELGSAEQFVKAMLSIPLAFSRIEAMLYRETFEDEVVHLRKSFSMLEEACKELRSSRLFLKLLEAVLKTGNRMNVGTIRGGAKAFKLDALLKLADVKGTDGRTTLLHFVVQEIVRSEGIRVSESIMGKISQKGKTKNAEEREEDYRRMGLDLVLGLSIELCNVKKTATIDLDVLASSVSNLSDGMTKLKHLIIKDLCVDEKSANFVKSMRSFLGYVENNLKELREDEGRVLLHVREITEYFHGDVSKEEANPLRIFVIVRDFLGMLDHVCKELRNSKLSSNPNPLNLFR
ncbi:unnamed protein product [Camellia sinensis]